jgi:hypothetical protein
MEILRFFLKFMNAGNSQHMTKLHNIQFRSWLPLWLLPFLIIGLTAFACYCYYREKRLNNRQKITISIFRSLAYISLLFLLALPVFRISGEGSPPGPLPVIIDATESMQIKDVNDKSRIESAFALAKDIAEKNPYPELTPVLFRAGHEFIKMKKDEKQPIADGPTTSVDVMLAGGTDDFAGEFCPGVILITDGADNSNRSISATINRLKKKDIPVYACGIGKERSKDIAVTSLMGEDVVFVDEKAKLLVNIRQYGYNGEDAELKIFLNDKEIFSDNYPMTEDGELSFPVEYTPTEKGTYILKAQITGKSGEITVENNMQQKNIRVIDEKIKILMVFGAPSWEYRYLNGAFERDKRVDVKVYMPDIDPRVLSKGNSKHYIDKLPLTVNDLNRQFDIVFISRIDVHQLPRQFLKILPEYVDAYSGSVAMLSDPSFIPHTIKGTPLEALVPLNIHDVKSRTYRDELFLPLKEEFTFKVTEDGNTNRLVLFSGNKKENSKIWSELPPVNYCYTGGGLKPSSINLLVTMKNKRGQEFPAIVYHSYGKGTVLFMAFDSTWRWRKEYGDRYFRDFWGKAVQFLGLPHLLNESAQSVIFAGDDNSIAGEKMSIRARVCNADYSPFMGDSIELSLDENGVKRKLKMNAVPGRAGIFKTNLVPGIPGKIVFSLPGKYQAKAVEVHVSRRRKEFLKSNMNRKLLTQIAGDTGGLFFHNPEYKKILDEVMKNRPMQQIYINITFWDTWLMLAIVVLLFSVEWVFRKLYYLD